MTTTAIKLPEQPAAGWLGQATAIEQSRAIEEVRAAIIVAQQCPRDEETALAAMRRTCSQRALAARAFYAFPRAGEDISGPSVYLARELARCWGNISHGHAELRRDDAAGQSELQAFAWDLQTNTRSAQIFIVPHKRDTKRGAKALVDMRDIYENNANNGARRLREAIFAVLPMWYVDEAKDLCRQTLANVSGAELAQRIDVAVKAFERRGVTVSHLEKRLQRAAADWDGEDFAQLDILFGSLKRGEISREEITGTDQVTTSEIVGSSTTGGDWPATAEPGGGS